MREEKIAKMKRRLLKREFLIVIEMEKHRPFGQIRHQSLFVIEQELNQMNPY